MVGHRSGQCGEASERDRKLILGLVILSQTQGVWGFLGVEQPNTRYRFEISEIRC